MMLVGEIDMLAANAGTEIGKKQRPIRMTNGWIKFEKRGILGMLRFCWGKCKSMKSEKDIKILRGLQTFWV